MKEAFKRDSSENRWKTYYEHLEGRPPHNLLLDTLTYFEAEPTNRLERHAIDLGCGDGTETAALLHAGWSVLAIDQQSEAIARVQAKVLPMPQAQLETQVISFEEALLPQADLIYAAFSLPFCSPQRFGSVWSKIVGAVNSGGRFVGHLFGDRDSWAMRPNMTFHTIHEAQNLFEMFEIERFNEIDEDGFTATKHPKHWHVYEIIARKLA